MNRRDLPPIGILLGLALIVVSTRLYPGGTLDDPAAAGFDWSRVYLTQVFRPIALNGQVNAARPFAVAGLWLYCASMAALFWQLGKRMGSTRHGKWVEISGIAAMVYTALTVTRMHDLMVTIALVLFVAADLVMLAWLLRQRWLPELTAGIASLALLLVAAFIYYGKVGMAALPALQKVSALSSAAWLLWLQRRCAYRLLSPFP